LKIQARADDAFTVPQMAAPTFDLQSHSTYSDGALSPAEVVARAAAAGVELLALTDHDTVDGVDEALAAGRDHGVRVARGVELTAVRAPDADVHVLGYELDHHDRGLADFLAGARADRELRMERMADRMEELGLELDRSEMEARRAAGLPVGRPHLAAAVLEREGNRERLRAEGADTLDGLFSVYLVAGARAWVPRTQPSVEEAIAAIHAAGGVAVWAHPWHDVDEADEVLAEVDRFRAAGLDGVECFYVEHDRERTERLCDHCEATGLLRTGSADFHGPDHPRYSRFRAFSLYGREPELGPVGGG
jgi:predicted metal-dependent phosphoesterase TrpH